MRNFGQQLVKWLQIIKYFSLMLCLLVFCRELEGRYVKLVGYAGTDSSRFNNLIQNIKILTTAKILCMFVALMLTQGV